jgi:hypothetical protein
MPLTGAFSGFGGQTLPKIVSEVSGLSPLQPALTLRHVFATYPKITSYGKILGQLVLYDTFSILDPREGSCDRTPFEPEERKKDQL